MQLSFMQLAQPGSSGDNVVVQVLVLAAFVLIPIVRGILQQKEKKKKERAPRSAPPAGGKPKGLDMWERILRGEDPQTPAARPPAPPAPPAPGDPLREPAGGGRAGGAAPLRRARPAAQTTPLAPAAPRTLGERPRRDSPLAPPVQEGSIAPTALGELREDPVEFAGLSSAFATLDDGGGPGGLEMAGLHGLEPERPAAAPVRVEAPLAPELEGDWRRALVAAEILGPPVGMRGPDGGPTSPVGLR